MNTLLSVKLLLTLTVIGALYHANPQTQSPPNFALLNGQWFNGRSFEPRTVYTVNGRITSKKPERVDRTFDLTGTWIVPPFGEAHNHNVGTGAEEEEKKRIQNYLADGVFYVKIQGNLPLTDASFLALEGNPIEDLQNVRKIKLRFKQDFLLDVP